MWKQLKNRLNQLFESNPDKNDQKDYTSLNSQDREKSIEAKVAFNYPKKTSYNFPMSVDQTPKRVEEKPKNRQLKKSEKIERSKPVIHTKDESQKQTTSVKRKPFKVSDVPSPVYGFKQRQPVDKLLKHTSFEDEKEEASIIDPNWESRRDQPIKQEEKKQYHNMDADTQSEKENIMMDRTNSKPTEQEEPSVVASNKTTQPTHKKREPFNVRMRPSDKKRYAESRKQKRAQTEDKQLDHLNVNLLNEVNDQSQEDKTWLTKKSELLIQTLEEFNVKAKIANVMQGPSVTRFEIQPETGVKVSKVKNLSDDIKLNMAAKDIRIEAPIPGKNAIGIEVPNDQPSAVNLMHLFNSDSFKNAQSPLTIGLGLDISGRAIVSDIKKMPHGLIAGATGSGKSVCINAILLSLLFRASPEEVRLLLIDPKMVELAPYNDIPHLISPVITDVKAATQSLKWAVKEMEERYMRFVEMGVRDIDRYNEKVKKDDRNAEKLPHLVIVIDELSDLMMASPQDVEDAICRIAQKARAAGIHLLLATQRPSVDVITGLIKANIPTRIAFSVASQVDSRTMIDTNGAERLLGKGDMLFVENGARTPVRIQGAYVSDEEIERITQAVRHSEETHYLFEQDQLLEQTEKEEIEDSLYDDALQFAIENESISTSLLQRRFKIGYNRAARMIDALESEGMISGQNGSKPRQVLVTSKTTN
ncbi:DNA segregation ATPase FtsK/SpoIIIE, S-DNA-T family [Pelagirhabdus alkalitolerans]|uniref:DNA segregation ATPase FtsK/SpoIIIE, S-DNA-T family n=2 Tax=Pelagirhabdus alkalitolerans TaxID=1612202 RepID=A0A1G6HIF9_9BACI|nr:DNA segregation ATPase FtsK/SpoIIIE, S-DNA-T family [Pelagirhabdus alkalitolerans]